MDGRLAGSISWLTLLASARAWVCPTWQSSLSLGLLVGQQAPGEGGEPWLAWLDHLPGAEQAAGGASEDLGLTLASSHPPVNYSNSPWWHHPFPSCHCSHIIALPQSGEEVPCAVGFGDRKQAL